MSDSGSISEPAFSKKCWTRIYSSRSAMADCSGFVKNAFRDLLNCRELAWSIFWRDLRVSYRQSYLGFFWSLIPIVVSTAVWMFINSQKIVDFGETDIPYPVYVLTGILLFELFTSGIIGPVEAFRQSLPVMTKINMPGEGPLLASLGSTIFQSHLRLMLLLPVLLYVGYFPPVTIVLAPLILTLLACCAMAVGIMLIPVSVAVPDLGNSIRIMFPILFIATPIVYVAPTTWPGSLVVYANPMASLLLAGRTLLVGGVDNYLGLALVWLAISLLLLFSAWISFRVAVPHLIARMSA